MHFQGSQAPGNRVEFLDILRGLSSVSVAICHLLIQFFLAPNEYARIIMATPIQQQIVPEWIGYISWIGPNLIITNVAVFFLISGFVIPFSFKKDVLSTYYIKRFFRLYPVYLISLALSICAIVGSALYWQQKVIYNECDWLYNFLLLQDVFIVAFIIPPVWTLVIEIKFYFLAPFFQRYLKKGKIYPYLLLALSLAMYFSYVTSGSGTDIDQFWNHHRYLTRYILRELMFISYITIGSVFFAHHKLLISNRTFVLSVVFIYLCFFISEPISPLPSMSGHYQTPMLWGLIIFTIVYFCKHLIKKNVFFQFLADISYPLYLIHYIFIAVIMRILLNFGFSAISSLLICMILAIIISYFIHRIIEAPSIECGTLLTSRKRK